MQEILNTSSQSFHPTKAMTTILLAAGITFALFVIMDKLTQIEGEYVPPTPVVPLDGFVFEERKVTLPEKERIKPVEKPLPPPDSLTKLEPLTPDSESTLVEFNPELPETKIVRTDMNAFSMNDNIIFGL